MNEQAAVASGSAYQALAGDIFGAQQRGLIYRGALTTNPEVTALHLTASPAEATLTDCLDTSDRGVVFASSGNNAKAPDQQSRIFYSVTAQQVPDGTWRISDFSSDRGHAC
ncbi:hypothetical protein [Kitasatospora sp. NPDC057198]|uniref:hypothetical protein n=1 Tax=Kitasatospora sp. NPDC057198 TaxID=3346046 RepID=UPI003638A407